ncbi:hypothetical protein GGR52DRAFT_572910 [Hypoxylon sp. FL1284]|nr:hypothetical protein GGR52DRAFT_572910 [Hypoxylon sp. FL1284]
MHLGIIPALLLIGLTAVAIYVQVTSSNLSLPLSTGTTALTILLPILAAVNIFSTRLPPLSHFTQHSAVRHPAVRQPALIALQLIQGVLAVVLATLTAEGFAPGQTLECSLEGNWQNLWHTHDDRAIGRIQDTFNCCGLRSLVDRNAPGGQCQKLYKDRHFSCINPWRASMQRTAGLSFGIAVAVGLLQLVQLGLFILRTSEGGRAGMVYRRPVRGIDVDPSERLLRDGVVDDDDDDDNHTDPEANNGSNGGQNNYGTTQDGPRVQPSNLGEGGEENGWR